MAEEFMTHFRFNIEITIDRFSFTNIQKKPSENFQEYTRCWRTKTARVQPPLDESELSKYFIRAKKGIYFDKMMSMMDQKLVELVKMGDFIEEGVKYGKIQSMVPHRVYNTQPHYNPPRAPAYQNPPRPYVFVQASIHQNRPSYAPRPCLNLEARNARAYTPIAEPYTQLFKRLRTAGVLQPAKRKLSDPIPHNFDGNRRGVIKCTPSPPNVNNNPLPNHKNQEVNMVTLDDEYGAPDYPNIDETDALTSLAEPLTIQTYLPRVVATTLIARKPEYDNKAVPWDYRAGAKGKMIDTAVAQGMTRSRKCYAPEDLNQKVLEKEQNRKKNVTDVEVAEFWKKMQSKDYSVEEQLKKSPAHISIWSLLMSSEAYRNTLMEVLSGVNIPKETTSETLCATI
ncbi:hypothetical protein H5410_041264 [Solanum commersonii]|uniref:Uncharacterized protein n=1 Tax=Solanum commersonii TaxID=4109 RepID=A0A9J5XUZ3_SOLCO|nr:hypothetical protein H5410_041264 [Solanum commersonii]